MWLCLSIVCNTLGRTAIVNLLVNKSSHLPITDAGLECPMEGLRVSDGPVATYLCLINECRPLVRCFTIVTGLFIK